MGSLISHLVFTPPKKHIEQDPEIEGDEILTTSHGSQIQIKSIINDEKYYYLLVSHDNTEDINSVYDWATKILMNYLNVNVIMYEYTGYGANLNNYKCSEQFCYNDIDTVYNYMLNKRKIKQERIVLFGRGLGTGPSVYLAAKTEVAGLILMSGFLSIYRIMTIKDEIIPFYHAKELYKNVRNKFDPLYIDNTSHNNIDKNSDDAYKHLQKFFSFLDPDYESLVPNDIDDSNF